MLIFLAKISSRHLGVESECGGQTGDLKTQGPRFSELKNLRGHVSHRPKGKLTVVTLTCGPTACLTWEKGVVIPNYCH